jgi:recombination protein RecA
VTIGMRMKVKIVKNKVAPPFRQAEFDMFGDRGISYEGDVLDLAAAHRVVDRSGSWFTYGDQKLGQGREKARAYLEEHPEVTKELREKVLAAYLAQGGASPTADAAAAEE